MQYLFPENFLFGAATSSHQVEGGNNNDWTEFEERSAERLAQAAKDNPLPGQWPQYILDKSPSPLEKSNYISGRAADHYNRFNEDFDIAKSLAHNAHRLSIGWSRIEPEEGVFNENEIEHYRAVIRALRDRGMEPFVTLWHFALPKWLADKGGVLAPDFAELFARYAATVAQALGESVRYWVTINEPGVLSVNGYYRGVWPPEIKGVKNLKQATENLVDAHIRAYTSMKDASALAHIGASFNISAITAGGSFFAKLKGSVTDKFRNDYLLARFVDAVDFVGVNYYFHQRVASPKKTNEQYVKNDMGWEIYPEGLYNVIRSVSEYGKPIFITENGVADARDSMRSDFIHDNLAQVARALGDGADIRGYFYWSLLDNFEWDKGFWPRFGLVDINYETLERTVRQSAATYKDIIERGIEVSE